jgi:murein DD-endopeptidase MepM/ murein hydrolase activator NlpD
VSALAAANGIANPNRIVIGQVLTLTSGSTRTSSNPSVVIVQPGDTLSKISARTGVPVATIVAANGLTSTSTVYAGGQLFLSSRNTPPVTALVRCPVPGARFMNDWGFARSDTGFHQGNDMMASRGAAIAAPVSGTVTQTVGTISGNQFRLVGSDGTLYVGAHLQKFGKSGKVKAGDTIGYVGDTGDARGGPTHLHFEIHPAGGAAVNPYSALVAACR